MEKGSRSIAKPKHSEAKEEEVSCHNVDRKAAYPPRLLPHRFGSSKRRLRNCELG
jgi:hypothetical protein